MKTVSTGVGIEVLYAMRRSIMTEIRADTMITITDGPRRHNPYAEFSGLRRPLSDGGVEDDLIVTRPPARATTLRRLGAAHLTAGNREAAQSWWRASLELFQQHGAA